MFDRKKCLLEEIGLGRMNKTESGVSYIEIKIALVDVDMCVYCVFKEIDKNLIFPLFCFRSNSRSLYFLAIVSWSKVKVRNKS